MQSSLRKFTNEFRGSSRHHRITDTRKELGQSLEPFGCFDADIERFCCRGCGDQFQTYRGIEAHLIECAKL